MLTPLLCGTTLGCKTTGMTPYLDWAAPDRAGFPN
jgi:hypothetical protein